MPTSKYFSKFPPFPGDLPVADIQSIKLSDLEQSNATASQDLFQACRKHGFFLLDLEGSSNGDALLQAAEAMFDLTDDVFDLGKETLAQYAWRPPHSLEGYKTSGILKTDDGRLDAMETYTVNRDDILGETAALPKPDVFDNRKRQCQDFCLRGYAALCTILNTLDKKLDLPVGTLTSLAPLDKPSASSIRMLRARPGDLVKDQCITLGGHTDIGAITMLFNVVGGLQILPGDNQQPNSEWQYVRPREGCALINIGDCLVEWTGGVLKSCLHRVHNPPGEQAKVVRRSVAYFIRPSHDGSMRRLEGGSIIPPIEAKGGEDERVMSPDEWASWRTTEIIMGRLKPETRGGIPISIDRGAASVSTASEA